MQVRLDTQDTLEIVKALKSGILDISRVQVLKKLVENYRPFVAVSPTELKECMEELHDIGIIPTQKEKWIDAIQGEYEEFYLDALWGELIRSAYYGVLALEALGYTVK